MRPGETPEWRDRHQASGTAEQQAGDQQAKADGWQQTRQWRCGAEHPGNGRQHAEQQEGRANELGGEFGPVMSHFSLPTLEAQPHGALLVGRLGLSALRHGSISPLCQVNRDGAAPPDCSDSELLTLALRGSPPFG